MTPTKEKNVEVKTEPDTVIDLRTLDIQDAKKARRIIAKCGCGDDATNQAVYRRLNGSHFLGATFCDAHRTELGEIGYAPLTHVVSHIEIVHDDSLTDSDPFPLTQDAG